MKHFVLLIKRLAFLSAISLVLLAVLVKPANDPQGPGTVDVAGVWRVSGGYDNRKDVCIKADGNRLEGEFIYGNYCDYPHEDSYFPPQHASGMARSLFLSGTQEGASAKGRISACTHVKKLVDDCHLSLEYQASFQDAELSKDTITIKYKPDYVKHDQDNTGQWTNCNVIPNGADEVKVTLTRRKPCNSAAACSYHVTRDEIRRAVEEECRKRHIELPSYWEAASGIGNSVPPNEIGFVLPLEQYPILVVGGVSVDPCKSSGDGAIQVELFVVEMKKVNGKWQKGKIIKRIDGAGSGDFSPKGLNQAIGGGLDAANLDQYRVGSSS